MQQQFIEASQTPPSERSDDDPDKCSVIYICLLDFDNELLNEGRAVEVTSQTKHDMNMGNVTLKVAHKLKACKIELVRNCTWVFPEPVPQWYLYH